jgi:branched-chain amino acid transport system substrate-binding protein
MTRARCLVVVPVALLSALLSTMAGAGEAQASIRIGASVSQTGSFAALGQNQLRGYQLCVNQANEEGGVLGRKIEPLVNDDESKAATAVATYEKLIGQDKVDAILGPYSRSTGTASSSPTRC